MPTWGSRPTTCSSGPGQGGRPLAMIVRRQRMDIGWRHFQGLAVMAVGVYWIVKRDVPIGIEGRPPSFHAKGRWAVVLGTAAIIVGDRPRRRHHPHGRPAHGLQDDEQG